MGEDAGSGAAVKVGLHFGLSRYRRRQENRDIVTWVEARREVTNCQGFDREGNQRSD